jgi:hypothetical protein
MKSLPPKETDEKQGQITANESTQEAK